MSTFKGEKLTGRYPQLSQMYADGCLLEFIAWELTFDRVFRAKECMQVGSGVRPQERHQG